MLIGIKGILRGIGVVGGPRQLRLLARHGHPGYATGATVGRMRPLTIGSPLGIPYPYTRVGLIKLVEAAGLEPREEATLEAARPLWDTVDRFYYLTLIRLARLINLLIPRGHVAIHHLPFKELPLKVGGYPI